MTFTVGQIDDSLMNTEFYNTPPSIPPSPPLMNHVEWQRRPTATSFLSQSSSVLVSPTSTLTVSNRSNFQYYHTASSEKQQYDASPSSPLMLAPVSTAVDYGLSSSSASSSNSSNTSSSLPAVAAASSSVSSTTTTASSSSTSSIHVCAYNTVVVRHSVPRKKGKGYQLLIPAPTMETRNNTTCMLSDAVHPKQKQMKQMRKRKTAGGTVGGAVVGVVFGGPIGLFVGGAVGGLASKAFAKRGEKKAQHKHEQRSHQNAATARAKHWNVNGNALFV